MLSKALFKRAISLSNRSFVSFSNAVEETIRTPIAQMPGLGQIQNVTLLPGSGVGPEVTKSVQEIFDAAHCPIRWDVVNDFKLSNPSCIAKLKKNECILMGTLPHKEGAKYINNEVIYKELDLYANLTYGKSLPNVANRHKKLDVVVLRENTEGEYSNIEHEVYPGVVESIKVITRDASLRIAEYAFEFAYLSGRKKVTAVHKANIMKICDGMFLEATREVSGRYPFIEYEEMIIDNCCMQIVKNPWQFDVMVMPNLYGSIISNALAGIVGGPGLTCGANIGKDHVIFEQATRHVGRDIAGEGKANPTALILSSIMMLKHLNLIKFANSIENALDRTYKGGKVRTHDIGGSSSTQEFTRELIKNLHP